MLSPKYLKLILDYLPDSILIPNLILTYFKELDEIKHDPKYKECIEHIIDICQKGIDKQEEVNLLCMYLDAIKEQLSKKPLQSEIEDDIQV